MFQPFATLQTLSYSDEVGKVPETLIPGYQTTRHHISEVLLYCIFRLTRRIAPIPQKSPKITCVLTR